MSLQELLNDRGITKYRLSQISGIPKTTIIDICSGKSRIEKCSAKTVYQLAQALDCSMEDIMALNMPRYDGETGLPADQSYFERGLPE